MTRRGKPNFTIRLDDELWDEFGHIAPDRSAVVRDFIRWFTRQPGAKLPKRPDIDRTDDPQA